MPKPKAKGKKDTVSTAKELNVVGNGQEEVPETVLSKQDDAIINDEHVNVPVKTTNGRGGRGKKVDKVENEEIPAKKATVSKGRGKKKAEVVEVIAKETENAHNSNGVESVEVLKEEVVAKGKGGKGKRGTKAQSQTVEDVVDNGEQKENGISEETTEKLEVAKKGKSRGGKKTAKINKDLTEAPKEVVSEEDAEADTKIVDTNKVAAAKTGGRKKKVDENEVVASIFNEKENNDNDTEPEPPKKKGRGATKKTPVKEEKAIANVKVEEQPKEEEEEPKVESTKKPTKRGAKESTKDKTEVEKIPAKRARSGKTIVKVEEAVTEESAEIMQTEEIAPKKRSRKEPSVEKELKTTDSEKPKKGRGGKKKTEKVDEEEDVVAEPKLGKEEDTEKTAEATKDSKQVEKPTTSRGGRKRAAPSTNKAKITVDNKVDDDKSVSNEANDVDEEDEADGSKPSKTKKKKEPSAAPINATSTKYNKADFDLPPLAEGVTSDEPRFNLKISSWNVAGLRSWVKKEGLQFLEYEEPDIFCLQETKCTTDQLPDEVVRIPGYHPYWLCMPGGYAGVAIYSKIMPINVEYGIGNKEFDDVGRLITAEYEKFFLINVYVPNSGRKLVNLEPRMKWEKLFQEFVQQLNDRKPVVICGDMNVSHQEIDLANPKTNTRNAGFTKEERNKMTELLSLGYVDTFRHLYPDRKGAYTFWTYMGNARSRNVGWRLDYFIVSERFIKRVVDNCIRSQCMGSDHCPITLFLKM